MAIRSEEVNYLIYRYLQESGFEHTAFAFAYESTVADTKVYDEYLPPGSLITYLQKALQYIELETHVRDDGSEVECNSSFSLIHPHKCAFKKKDSRSLGNFSTQEIVNSAMEIESDTKEIPVSRIETLEGHTSNVITCKWSPTEDKLITGSSDSTVRMWSVEPSSGSGETHTPTVGPVLSHTLKEKGNNEIIDVDWSPNGEMIVSSSYGGEVELWSANGSKLTTLAHFNNPAFNVSFAPDSSKILVTGALPSFYIYSLSSDKQVQDTMDAIALNELIKQKQEVLEFPSNTIVIQSLWKDANCVSLVDNYYHIYNLYLQNTHPKTIQIFSGHEAEINSIQWTVDGSLLISGAEDGVIKLWSEQRNESVFEFLSHHARVNKVLASCDSPSTFFSCSDDRTVKLFDITSASMIASLNQHDAPVTTMDVASSLLASCGLDRYVYFTDLRTQQVVQSYHSPSFINDISLSKDGTRLAVATVDSQVYLLDLRV